MRVKNPQKIAESKMPSRRHQRGFSLFELTAFIIITAIIYSVAVNRFSDFPEAAERANFLSIITQIQTGLNLEVMLGVTSGVVGNVREFDGINPMDLMLQPPANYLGAFGSLNPNQVERRSWYFDLSNSELVYLVNQSENVYLVENGRLIPSDEIRLQVVVLYRDVASRENVTLEELESRLIEQLGEGFDNESAIESQIARARVSGAVLRPSTPFEWLGAELDLEAEI